MEGRCRQVLHSPIRTPSHAHRLPFPPWRTLHAPSGGSSTMLAARSPPPSPSQRHPRVLLCSCGRRPGCRPPPPRMIAVSPPPSSNSHRPLRPLYTCAPFIYPCFPCVISVTSRASARSLADFPPFPPTCAQVQNSTIYFKLTRPRRGEAVIAVWNNPTGLGGRCGATLGLVGRALWR